MYPYVEMQIFFYLPAMSYFSFLSLFRKNKNPPLPPAAKLLCLAKANTNSTQFKRSFAKKGLLQTFSYPFDFNVNTDTVTFISWMMTFLPCRHKPVWTYWTTGQWGFSSCFIARANTVGFFLHLLLPQKSQTGKHAALYVKNNGKAVSVLQGFRLRAFSSHSQVCFWQWNRIRLEPKDVFWICGFGE